MGPYVAVRNKEDIFPKYQGTPIGLLLEYHNLGRFFEMYDHAELLVATCMDYRVSLNLPDKFAYIIRTGGTNLRPVEFQVSYAVSVGKIRAIALIGHTNCAMVNLAVRRENFIEGLVQEAGWYKGSAEEHFDKQSPAFEIGNELDFTLSEAMRLRKVYPKILVAPMIYNLEGEKLWLLQDDK
jgi:carbonic anhydrase